MDIKVKHNVTHQVVDKDKVKSAFDKHVKSKIDILSYIDVENLSRTFNTFTFETNDIHQLNRLIALLIQFQYRVPVKYLKPVSEHCSYVARKSVRAEDDLKNYHDADVIIEPMHHDIFNTRIPSFPINQHIAIDSEVTIHVNTPYLQSKSSKDVNDITQLGLKGIWSNDLVVTNPKEAFKDCSHKVLCNRSIHIDVIDVGSELNGTFKVSWLDRSTNKLHPAFGFMREKENVFTMWTYDHLEHPIKDVLTTIKSFLEKPDKIVPTLVIDNDERKQLMTMIDKMISSMK